MLTVKQAAERLGVSATLVYELVADGALPCYRLGGRGRRGVIRFSEADLLAFLERRRVEHRPADPARPDTGAARQPAGPTRFRFLPPELP